MNKPFFIAEIGINHNGSIDLAKQLIDMAVECGCDAVKFQKRTVEKCYTQEFLDQPRESPWGTTQREQKHGLEFSPWQYAKIDAYCKSRNIPWFASAWDIDSQIFLRQYDLKYNKIASRMIANVELLVRVAEEKKFTFISTGIDKKYYIDVAVDIFKTAGCPFMLMHCIPLYPCPDEKDAFESLNTLKELYNVPVGYSCHNPNRLSPVVGVLEGAEAIEVHITLDRLMYGTDQKASSEREELAEIVRNCRLVRAAI